MEEEGGWVPAVTAADGGAACCAVGYTNICCCCCCGCWLTALLVHATDGDSENDEDSAIVFPTLPAAALPIPRVLTLPPPATPSTLGATLACLRGGGRGVVLVLEGGGGRGGGLSSVVDALLFIALSSKKRNCSPSNLPLPSNV